MTRFDPAAFLQAFAIIAFLCAVVGVVLAVCWAACDLTDGGETS